MQYTDNKTFNWQDLAAGGYSALNSALFGIPDALVKVASSDAYEQLKKLREENKLASTIGDIGGMFVPTGGALAGLIGKGAKLGAGTLKAGKLASGLGKVAQAADTASDIIRTGGQLTGVKGAAIRGALGAAEQAVPRVLSGQQTVEQGLLGTALGAGVGGGLKALGKVIPARSLDLSSEKIQGMLEDTALSGRGLKTQHLKKALSEGARAQGLTGSSKTGYGIKRADEMKSNALKMFKKFGLENDDDIAEFLSGEGKKWEKVAEVFNKKGIKTADLVAELGNDPEVQELIRVYGDDALGALTKVMNTAGKGRDVTQVKSILQKNIAQANKGTTTEQTLVGDMSRTLREKIDDLMLDLDPQFKEMKSIWKDIQPLRQMALEEKIKIDPLVTKGSDTAAKQLMMGLGAAGGVSAAAKEFDINDPSTWGKAALTAGTGLVAGNVLNRVAPALASKVLGKGAELALDVGEKVAPMLAGKTEPITNVISKAVGTKAGPALIKDTEQTEQTVEPEVAEETKQEHNAQYINVLKGVMQQDYQLYFADQMSYDEFEAQVAQLTNGFDPLKTAAILFKDPKQRDKYLRDYNVALKLKSTDIDTTTKPVGAISALLDPASAAQQRKAYTDIVDAIASLVTNEGNIPSQAVIKQIQADIKAITDLAASPQEKQQLLMQKLEEKYGLSYGLLTQLGVV